MQMVKSGIVANFRTTKLMWFAVDLEDNKIATSGCRWLTKANWVKLTEIYFSKMYIIYAKMECAGKVPNIWVTVTGQK